MTKQCGTCQYWDRQPDTPTAINTGECKAPMPRCVKAWDRLMLHYEGQDCPVYEERKE